MTLQEFTVLPETQKTTALCELGAYVGERKEDYYDILLYKVDDFFVELFYSENSNEIAHVNSFAETESESSLVSSNFASLN
jgi:hypothetical protein